MQMPACAKFQASGRMLSASTIIIFGTDWNRHPSTIQHVARCLAGSHQIFWVETVGLRAPSLSWHDVRRSGQKLWDFATFRREGIASEHPNIEVLCPVTLPFTLSALVRRFNRWSVRRRLTRSVIVGRNDVVLILTCPHQVDYIGLFGEVCSLYFCMDDYALWPGMNIHQIAEMERDMLEKVDGVVAVSDDLAARLGNHGRPVKVISQGVDVTHFAIPPLNPGKTKSEIVYFGMIDSRVDQNLLLKVARAFPNVVIRLIGPIATETGLLREVNNIQIEPAVTYAKLPAAVSTADLFILPFTENPLTKSCTPLKLKEYLATGRPVISTWNPNVEQWREHLEIASSHDQFIAQLQRALEKRMPKTANIRNLLKNETWDIKTSQLLEFAEQVHSLKIRSGQPAGY
jgi:glycosyltransferase involved in cell wall biosynthesis